eukprot:1011616-Rhodomonas_salina.5
MPTDRQFGGSLRWSSKLVAVQLVLALCAVEYWEAIVLQNSSTFRLAQLCTKLKLPTESPTELQSWYSAVVHKLWTTPISVKNPSPFPPPPPLPPAIPRAGPRRIVLSQDITSSLTLVLQCLTQRQRLAELSFPQFNNNRKPFLFRSSWHGNRRRRFSPSRLDPFFTEIVAGSPDLLSEQNKVKHNAIEWARCIGYLQLVVCTQPPPTSRLSALTAPRITPT